MSRKKNQQSIFLNNSSIKKRSEKNRKTGIGIVGTIPWGTHLCQFYQTKEDLIDILVPYFKAGLENNEFCMWITSEPLRVNDARKALSKKVKNLEKYIQNGQIEILDSTEWYTKSGKFDTDEVLQGWIFKEKQAREKGFDGLRLTGNTFWLEKKDWGNFTNYEEIINNVIGNYRMIALCSYSLDKCNASEIIDVVSNHQFALIKRGGQWHRIESPEMKKKEVALDESKSLLETVFSSMNDAVVVLNKSGDIINFNEAFARFCRFNTIEECRRSVSEFAKIIKAYTLDGKLLPVEEWPAARGLKGEIGVNKEFLIKRTDLGKTWVASTNFAPLRNKNNEIIGVVQTLRDITERKESEREMNRQVQLLNQVQDGIIGSDSDFRITYWNKGAEQMYGYSEAEALGKTTKELLRPLYAPGEREKIIDDLKLLGTAKTKIRTKHRNGTEIIAEANSTKITNETGNIIGYAVTYRDVTDRERVQAALKEAETKYRTVADNTYDFEFWIDPKGRYLYVSPSCKRITGYTKEEFFRDPSLSQHLVHADDKQVFLNHMLYEKDKKKQGELEFRIIHKDGTVRWIHHVCQPILDIDGKFLGIRGSNRDITERKQIEEQVQYQAKLLESVSDAVISTGDDFRIVSWNQAAERLYGWRVDEVIGKVFNEIVPVEYPNNDRAKILAKFREKGIWQGEVIQLNRKGDAFYVHSSVTALVDRDGNPKGAIAINRDITDRKRIEQALTKQHDELQTILDTVPASIFYKDTENRLLRVNKSFTQMMDLSKAELEGKSLFDLYPREQAEAFWKDDKEVITSNKEKINIIEPVQTKKGLLWVQTHKIPYRDMHGNIIGVLGFTIDITGRKNAEEAFKKSELRYRRLFESAKDGILLIDFNTGMIIDVNPYLINLTGFSKNEFLKKHLWEIGVLKDVVPSKDNFKDLQKNQYIRYEDMPLLTTDGKKIDVEFVSNVYDVDGRKTIQCNVRNITERKKAEEQLRETRNYLENLLNYANAPIIVWDKDFKIVRFNHAFEHLTDYTSEMMIGKKLNILFPQESRDESLQKIQRTLIGEYWESVEIPILRKDKTIRIALWNSANIYDDQGENLIATIAQGTDITERKRAEEALKESETRLKHAQEIAHLGSWEYDLINNHLSWSDEVYKIFGMQPQEFTVTYDVFLEGVHPDDRLAVDLAYSSSVRDGKKTYDIEHRIVRKNGEIRFVHEKCEHIRNETGKIIRSIGMIHDITEIKKAETELIRLASFPANNPMPIVEIDLQGNTRYLNPRSKHLFPDLEKKGFNHPFLKDIKTMITRFKEKESKPIIREIYVSSNCFLQTINYIPENKRIRIYSFDITDRKKAEETLQESEEKYRRIVENTTNVIMVTQPDGIISYISPSCKELFGYLPEELTGMNPMIFHPDDTKKVQHSLSRALHGEKGSNFEYRILTKTGDVKWISHSWSPIFIENKIQSIISVIADITERKTTENKIKKLNDNLMRRSIELAVANKELETFSYSVSHDLRAPLRSIDGFSQALLEDYGNSIDENGKEYLNRVRNATQRMSQLIDDMLRLSRLTRVEMTMQKVDLNPMAKTVIEDLKKTDPERKITFIADKKLIVEGDANLLQILLENLLGNAWKFTKKRKKAEIEFGKTKHDQETVFFIRDNGAGFNMKYIDKLFIPFQRLHDDADYPGTGIGLGIVSRIIHRHGGRIWADAEENKGATFYFTLGGKPYE